MAPVRLRAIIAGSWMPKVKVGAAGPRGIRRGRPAPRRVARPRSPVWPQPSRAHKNRPVYGLAGAGSQAEVGDGRQVVAQLLVLARPEGRLELLFGVAGGGVAGVGGLAALAGEVDALGPAVGRVFLAAIAHLGL